MQTSSYWQRFTNTGRIEDYLNYKTHSDIETVTSSNQECVQGIANKKDESESQCKNSLV